AKKVIDLRDDDMSEHDRVLFVDEGIDMLRQALAAFEAQESQRRCSEPLTEEQAKALWNNWAKNHRAKPIDLIRAIEAAIKEKP
ncbi:hypothetical protein, partial [Lactococcus petauri]|uniref:hypothetical protein n=1 Tax=Lactococcus petauri TaxID=1940789 RepID=UPI0021F177EB